MRLRQGNKVDQQGTDHAGDQITGLIVVKGQTGFLILKFDTGWAARKGVPCQTTIAGYSLAMTHSQDLSRCGGEHRISMMFIKVLNNWHSPDHPHVFLRISPLWSLALLPVCVIKKTEPACRYDA